MSDELTAEVIAAQVDKPWYANSVARALVTERDVVYHWRRECAGAHLQTALFFHGFALGYRGAFDAWPGCELAVSLGMNYLMVGEGFADAHLSVIREPWMLGFAEGYRQLRASHPGDPT